MVPGPEAKLDVAADATGADDAHLSPRFTRRFVPS
jgi:hypothetical protein